MLCVTLFGLLLCVLTTQAYHLHRNVQALRKSIARPLRGYLAPELDPEFSGRSVQPNLFNVSVILPTPKEGDIVQCSTSWGVGIKNWEDHRLGRIRFLRFNPDKEYWIADVSPLEEGKAERVYTVSKAARSFFEPVSSLKPVSNFFFRSENGYKVAFKKNSTEVILKAPAYALLDRDFIPPAQQSVDIETLQTNLDSYSELKSRIIKTTLLFGGVGSVISFPIFGLDVTIPYASGAAAGGLYLFLLGKKIDGVGASYTLSNTTYSKVDSIASNLRLFVPVALMGGLAFKNSLEAEIPLKGLNTVTKEQFLAAALGFLTYRIAIFASEIASELRLEDILSILPGSAAEMYRQAKKMKKQGDEQLAKSDAISTVILLTGPKAAGRSGAVSQLLSKGFKTRKTKALTGLKYLTSSTAAWQTQPERYRLVTEEDLESLRSQGRIVFEFEEKNTQGLVWTAALSEEQFESSSEQGDVFILDGPPQLLETLSKVANIRLINIWISLQTKEQFIDKATSIVKSEMGITPTQTAVESVSRVSDLVDEAAKDITFYMQKAPLFDFTLLNSGTDAELIEELEILLSTAL